MIYHKRAGHYLSLQNHNSIFYTLNILRLSKMTTDLSKHFHIDEAEKSQTAIHHDIDNTASDHVHKHLTLLANYIVEPIRDEYDQPISPQSWYPLNKAIDSSDRSYHLQSLAVDIKLLNWDHADFAYWASEHSIFDKIILEYYQMNQPKSGWVFIFRFAKILLLIGVNF